MDPTIPDNSCAGTGLSQSTIPQSTYPASKDPRDQLSESLARCFGIFCESQSPSSKPSSTNRRSPSGFGVPRNPEKVVRKLDVDVWEHDTVGSVLKVTLDRLVAVRSGHETVWLKELAARLEAEGKIRHLFRFSHEAAPLRSQEYGRLDVDLADRLLISRLKIDRSASSSDPELLASLPAEETTFEYLVGAWRRVNEARAALVQKKDSPSNTRLASERLEKLRGLLISYIGFTLQEPKMFPQPSSRPIGRPEVINAILSLRPATDPYQTSPSELRLHSLTQPEIEQLLRELADRFEDGDRIDGILGPVVEGLVFHESLFRPEGLFNRDSHWRGVVKCLEVLVSVKSIAMMMTRMKEWNPAHATAATFEKVSLLGPVCRLGMFPDEWPTISKSYFLAPTKRTGRDIEWSLITMRETLNTLQNALFQIFNKIARASPEAREAVLQYFYRVISLNSRRAGTHVEPRTVTSDSFMINLQSVLYRFAEPFMDAGYTKIDRIDPLFYARSSYIDLKNEARINATWEEAVEWENAQRDPGAPAPNFVSHVFYIAIGMNHYGYLKTLLDYRNMSRKLGDLQRYLDITQGDGSWIGTPSQSLVQGRIKAAQEKVLSRYLAMEVQLREPDFLARSLMFSTFLSAWLVRQVDPKNTHPNPPVQMPVPTSVPMSFRVLPEYMLEDLVQQLIFVVQASPDKFEATAKVSLLTFVLTFLSATWYIKNPFLKLRINDLLFVSTWGSGPDQMNGVLKSPLNTHRMAIEHLMPALMHFYIEVEQTGANSQFNDKFNARRNISDILKVVWDNPCHRDKLYEVAKNDCAKFIRFVNLMLNDVTYLMDESLRQLTQIHHLQVEMDDRAAWNSRSERYRQEKEGTLFSLERSVISYTTLGQSTVELLKMFTAEAKAPFMVPEIVDKLAAMLDYNLVALVGPKYQELKVRQPEKLNFRPRELLSNVLQVYLNLSDQDEFITAVAGDGRSYSKAVFDSAVSIATKRGLKSAAEVAQLRAFVVQVEAEKVKMEAEDDELGDSPDEFLDPIVAKVMRDPVRLPLSGVILDRSTIKAHLLSDTTDPFNRAPLSIEDVLPEPEMRARIDAYLAERKGKANVAVHKDVNLAGGAPQRSPL
ncbi:putative ubiquitin elongating factor core [Lyophyllum shimeji]|uniref:RING-type E3 ubiquitin transferase n=1 Tax=Lyophyllum shimeji TaxID=47721 RepID=A0A9P3Q1M2_LYOSH|nr:putative ubiquitin elongating factor core [Lyophyllum shimeji]